MEGLISSGDVNLRGLNLQVRSIDVPYEMMYLSRIILVMHALEVDISKTVVRAYQAKTYKDPSANINPNANFFLKSSFNALSSITGRNIMIKSSRMLIPAAEYTKAWE